MTTPDTPADLDRLEALLAHATRRPWSVFGLRGKLSENGKTFTTHSVGPDNERIIEVAYSDRTLKDHIETHFNALLVAAAVNALPFLIARARQADELERREGVLREALEALAGREDECGEVVWDARTKQARPFREIARAALNSTKEPEHG